MKKTIRKTLINRHFSAPRWGGRRLLSIGFSALLSISTFLTVIPQTETIVYGEPAEELQLEEIPAEFNDTMIPEAEYEADCSEAVPADETDNTNKKIMLVNNGVASNIVGAQESSVYFGNYIQSGDGSGEYLTEPIKWRVLQNANGKLLLLADKNLDCKQYYKNNNPVSCTWENCTLRKWLNGLDENPYEDSFLAVAFSAEEQGVVATTAVADNTSDKVFLLSTDEVINDAYGFPNDSNASESRVAKNTSYVASKPEMQLEGIKGGWWLRSRGMTDKLAVYVNNDGSVITYGGAVNDRNVAVRPAFNLDLSSAIFTSAAEGGKTVTPGVLSAPISYDGAKGWKLTLKDDSISAQADGNISRGDNTVSVSYKTTGTGINRLSVLVTDKAYTKSDAEIKYYGALKTSGAISATGTGEFTLPDGFNPAWKVYLVAENINGDYKTDYAGEPSLITIPEAYKINATNDGHGNATATPTTASTGTLITLSATSADGYRFKNWTSPDGVKFADTTSASTTFDMPAKNVTVKANFEKEEKPVSIKDAKVVLKSAKLGYNGKNRKPVVKTIKGMTLKEGTDYTVSVKNSKGKVVKTYKARGKYTLVITGKGNYTGTTQAKYEIVKGTNPLNVTAKKKTYNVKYSKLKNKDQSINSGKIYDFKKKGAGKITYKLVSAKKGKKSYKKYFAVNSKGKLTIRKGLNKDTYTVKVNVKADGDKNYKAATKTLTLAVKVK